MNRVDENALSPESRILQWWAMTRRMPLFWFLLVVVLGLGFMIGGGSGSDGGDQMIATGSQSDAKATTWTCSMHPQIKLPEPGQCPICFMDLIPVSASSEEEDCPRVLSMSETAKKIARIMTTPVERRYVGTTIQMVGKVDYDETRLAHISSWVPGRLDRLYVDYTGIEVKKGDHMVLMYSPDLLTAQEELLQALRAKENTSGSGLSGFRGATATTVESTREKLRLLGLTDAQVKEIEQRGTAEDHVTIYSPIGGVVIEKNALEGKYVQTGTHIYTIADLSKVWLQLEAYESDLEWLRYGQKVVFETEALPGEEFEGTIAFIDPILDANTRTVHVRVNVSNTDRKLKPGMFVRARVTADIAASGLVTDVSLIGKWMCPMHPEVISDHAGDCTICGMPLVTTESLGYINVNRGNVPPPLVIPATAPLITGKRAVVYVELPDRDHPTYEAREVALGPRAGDAYIVASGLKEGESVVVNGAFKIDSELQIRAGKSMMAPDDMVMDQPAKPAKTPAPTKHSRVADIPSSFVDALTPLYAAYFDLHRALAGDDFSGAHHAMIELSDGARHVDAGVLSDSARQYWNDIRDRIVKSVPAKVTDGDWDALRAPFQVIAEALIDNDYRFGHLNSATHFVTFCPMAFDNSGAYWLADTKSIANPYFGHVMPKCGKVTDQIGPRERK